MLTRLHRFVKPSHFAYYSTKKIAIGIRREDKNCWERRTPLTPEHVQLLVDQGCEVYVEPCNKRAFTNDEYRQVGAKIDPDLSKCNLIMALKEVPAEKLIPDKTYMFFSHTIKAQPYNMGMLDAILEKNIRLIDYEKILNKDGSRAVKFGPFAGYAGTIDTLHMLGERLLLEYDMNTPLVNIAWSKNYISLDAAKEAIQKVGDKIKRVGLPREITPLTIVVTGDGSVSKAVLEILNILPVKYVDPSELKDLWEKKEQLDNKVIYVSVATSKHMVVPKDKNMPFDEPHYFAHPEMYEPVFHENVLPYARVIINGIYWDQKYPRLATIEQTRKLIKEKRFHLLALGDITCDPKGSLEFFVKATTITNPSYIVDIETMKVSDHTLEGPGVAVMGVDHLPAEFPDTASRFFANELIKFVKPIAESDDKVPFEQQVLPEEIRTAVITSNGKLTPSYQYIPELRKKRESEYNKILLLGSGLVCKPIVDYLMKFDKNKITIADLEISKAKKLAEPFGDRANATSLDVSNSEALDRLVSSHDIVLSLVPAPMHPVVARSCINFKKNMVTASYISPEMKSLDEAAKKAGVALVNELGLDPGIDHMSLMKMLEEIREKGGKVVSFKSLCGALPEPAASNNPLGYKFSWSPDGVISASQNPALFMYDGEVQEVPGESLMSSSKELNIYPGFRFVYYPNRDSMKYIDYYGLDKNAIKTMLRGTIRYPGFNNIFRSFMALDLVNKDILVKKFPDLGNSVSWKNLIMKVTGIQEPKLSSLKLQLVQRIFSQLQKQRDKNANIGTWLRQTFGAENDEILMKEALAAVSGMEKLGMLSDEEMVTITPTSTICSCLSLLLQKKLAYKEGEADLVIMNHELIVEYPQGEKERINSYLCLYGERGGYTATEKTVGLPVAIAAQLILDGKLNVTGVHGPNIKDIYDPVLEGLEKENIKMIEEREKIIEE